jgi:hypothetical protein
MSNSQQLAKIAMCPTSQAPIRRAKLFWVVVFVGFYLCVSIQSSAAQSRKCPQQTIDGLEVESDSIRDWSKLHAFYRRYRACKIDDAEVGEGVSESVARMLADSWSSLRAASQLFKQDPAFETFALAGLNITDLTGDLNHIDKLAAESCPTDLYVLCRKIRKSIHDNN